MRNPTTLSLAAFAAAALVAPSGARADYGNADRYDYIKGALRTAAPETNGWATGLAGTALDTRATPITLRRFDTPDNKSFSTEALTEFPYGPTSGGLFNPAAAFAMGGRCTFNDGRSYGIKTDLASYWWSTAAAPPYPACATNTHVMYNELLAAVRACGNRCYVDVASLQDIEMIQLELRGAIAGWLVGKPRSAKLILRITEGYATSNNSLMETHTTFFSSVVREGAGRVEVYGIPMATGTAGLGTWSHAKLFGVYNITGHTYRALWGGQNHWRAYDVLAPPFDTNTMVDGNAATALARRLDAALEWFDDGRTSFGRCVWWDTAMREVKNSPYKWNTGGFGNTSFTRFSGITDTNPRAAAGPVANQRALVTLIDMGAFSSGHLGRTIARVLHDLVAGEPRQNNIRVFNQQICRASTAGFGGNCGGRNEQTYVGRLVYRALTAAKFAWATNVWVMTASPRYKNAGYESPYNYNVRAMLERTGYKIACDNVDMPQNYEPGWNQLRTFNNPRGRGSCGAAVVRGINGRFAYRTATAFINGFPARQQVGLHHKLVMFGREAMFQGSFNAYPSVAAGEFSVYDSKLVENGAIIMDARYVSAQVNAFDEAWNAATPVIGGE